MMKPRLQPVERHPHGASGPTDDTAPRPVLLVVDDDPDILRVVRFYLSKQRYQVHAAESGREALELLQSIPDVELILSDVMMPEMSGLELLSEVRKRPELADIPVILISAESQTSKKVAGLNQGADDFITKPFNFDELMARVKNHIRLRRLQQKLRVASEQVLAANALLLEQNDRYQQDMDAARSLQLSLLPDSLPNSDRLRLGARYLPAERLGGDLYDVVLLDGGRRVGVLVADVCGHGVAAALITAMTKITFQSACQSSLDPAEVLHRMNRELLESMSSGFVSVVYGVYDQETRNFTYASGGHPPALWYRRSSGRVRELMPRSTFLGCFQDVTFQSDTVTLQPGDRLLLYTDGLFESRRADDHSFGMRRVHEHLRAQEDRGVQDLADWLIEALGHFMDGVPMQDDITIVALDVLG